MDLIQYQINILQAYLYNKFNQIQMIRNENHVILYKIIRLRDMKRKKGEVIDQAIEDIQAARESRKGKTSRAELEKMVMGLADGQEYKLVCDNLAWF